MIGLSGAVTPQSPLGDKLDGFTKSPSEHVIEVIEEPFIVRQVEGVVADPLEFPLPDTLFEIRGPGKAKTIRGARTDDNGLFAIRRVRSGTYRFKATRAAFNSVIGTLIVSKKADKSNTIKIKMNPGA